MNRLIPAFLLSLALASGLFAQTYGLTPDPKQTFFTTAGDPLANGKVYTYAAGTTTPRVTFGDSIGTQNSNPVILDAAGRATIYLNTALAYKFVVKTSTDVTIYTQDNIQTVFPTNFTITEGVIPIGTGTGNGLADGCLTDTGDVDTGVYTNCSVILGRGLIVGAATSDVIITQGVIVGINGIASANTTVNSVLTRLQSFGGVNGAGKVLVDYTGTAGYKSFDINVAGVDAVTVAVSGGIFDGMTVNSVAGALPTGGAKGAGTINVANNIYLNGTGYANPDFGLEHWATGKIEKFASNPGAANYLGLRSLEDVEDFARTNFYLPQLDVFKAHDAPAGLKERHDASLLLHEETFEYLFDLNDRIKTLEKKVEALTK